MTNNRIDNLDAHLVWKLNRIGVNLSVLDRLFALGLTVETNDQHLLRLARLLQGRTSAERRRVVDRKNAAQVRVRLERVFGGFEAHILRAATFQFGYDVLQMDETTVQVLKEDGRAAKSKSRMWVRRGGPPGKPIILFNYETTRSGAVAWRLLEDFRGYLQSDGYSGYIAVGRRDGMVHIACLAHARRKFDEALKARKLSGKGATGKGGLAAEGLALIQKIYRIEKVAREAKLTPDQRKQLRDEKARPIWNELRTWLDAKRGQAPPESLIGKALGYLDNQWAGLIRVLDDGRLEVDNNLCENALRPFVMGRKAWLFSDTPAGAEASARLYGLIETAKANGLEPYAYLKLVFTELPKAVTLADVEALLPWHVARPATPSVAA